MLIGGGINVRRARARYALDEQRLGVVISWVAAAGALGYSTRAIVQNLHQPGGPLEPPAPWWTTTPAAGTGLLLIAWLAWRAAGPDPLPHEVRPDHRSGTGRARMSVWSLRIISPWEATLAVYWTVLAGLYALDGDRPLMVFGSVAAVLCAARSYARLVIDGEGVRFVQPLLLGRTPLAVRHRDIVAVDSGLLEPDDLPSGMWGLIRRPGHVAYRERLRGGTLQLHLASGLGVFITLSPAAAADAAAAAVTAHRRSSS